MPYENDASNDKSEDTPASASDAPVVDPAVIAELHTLCGPEMLAKMVEQFIQDATLCVEEVELALEDGNPDKLAKAAHGLKGMSANFGAIRLQDLASHAEQLGRQGLMTDALQSLANLETEFSQTKETLRQHIDRVSQ
jgi:HPt (histidine-containing phosphotransfer) domain-containing protein